MSFSFSQRLKQIPPYLFAEIDRLKNEMIRRGVDVIDLGVGDPDLPTPPHIVERLKEAAEDPENHRYPSYNGLFSFRRAVSDWYKRRFGVDLDPEREVIALIGSKEGIAHLPLAFVDPGDIVLVPNPAYPVYHIGTIFAGGRPYYMPLLEENGFLPDLEKIPEDIARRAKLIFVNYPNNPTAAVADLDFFERLKRFAKKYNIVVCHDAAYTELSYDGYRPPSFLEVKGSKEIAIEFHSLSKTYNMTGWRIGFAVGNAEVIKALKEVKSNIDSGVFQAVQWAAIAALEGSEDAVEKNRGVFQERRDILIDGLRNIGLRVQRAKATFYLWARVPSGYSSASFSQFLLERAGIVTTPGSGFGDAGEGYIRIALTVPKERIIEAVKRLANLKISVSQ